MQKRKALTELTLQELQDRKQRSKGVLIGLGLVMLLACGTLIYLAIRVEKGAPFIAIASGCAMMFLPMIAYKNQLDTEIKKRNT
ncbi:hypothetical protein LLH06_12100 [Mucilaginibacter daejeonensis]|uniref:hypothetical protein n=1 Tax=Mucilaginibacter daejeonensis TaxID=398049 RepID=UPI001D16FBF5|nr:hypothetical protein [Mucilaginibacter daejeonensis]UEG51707.1 hypothetical protein LLH06_12100 [Mucilaginibacter daejeonensis]